MDSSRINILNTALEKLHSSNKGLELSTKANSPESEQSSKFRQEQAEILSAKNALDIDDELKENFFYFLDILFQVSTQEKSRCNPHYKDAKEMIDEMLENTDFLVNASLEDLELLNNLGIRLNPLQTERLLKSTSDNIRNNEDFDQRLWLSAFTTLTNKNSFGSVEKKINKTDSIKTHNLAGDHFPFKHGGTQELLNRNNIAYLDIALEMGANLFKGQRRSPFTQYLIKKPEFIEYIANHYPELLNDSNLIKKMGFYALINLSSSSKDGYSAEITQGERENIAALKKSFTILEKAGIDMTQATSHSPYLDHKSPTEKSPRSFVILAKKQLSENPNSSNKINQARLDYMIQELGLEEA